jgi:transposase
MSLGRQRERQADMPVSWAEIPRSPGHVFYDKLQAVLIGADFDTFVEDAMCEGICAASRPAVVAAMSLLPHATDRLF